MIELYKEQTAAVDWAIKKKKAAIYFDMGRGKTVIAAAIIKELRENSFLITCPKNVVKEWKFELNRMNPLRQLIILDKGSKKNILLLNETHFDKNVIVLASYHQLVPIFDYLAELKLGGVFIDEAHILRNWNNVTKTLLKKGMFEYKFLLTGTPTGNKLNLDYYFQLKFLEVIPMFKKQFKNKFVKTEIIQIPIAHVYGQPHFKKIEKVIGNKNEKELNDILSTCSIRWIEKKEDNRYIIEFKKHALYDQLLLKKVIEQPVRVWAYTSSKEFFLSRLFASGIVEEYLQKNYHVLQGDKLKWVRKKIATLKNERIVIWYNYNGELDVLNKMFIKYFKGRPIAYFSGLKKDLSLWPRKDCVLFAQIKSASLGINDLVSSHNVIYFSPPLSHIEFKQSLARTNRIGQTKTCNYYFLKTKATVETKIWTKLFNNQDFTQNDFEAFKNELK